MDEKLTIIWVPGSKPAKAAIAIDADLDRVCRTLRLYKGWDRVRKKFRIKQIPITNEVMVARFERSISELQKSKNTSGLSLTPKYAHCILPNGKRNWPYLLWKHVRC